MNIPFVLCRWGDARSPAYGELTDYYLAAKKPSVDRKKIWGIPSMYTRPLERLWQRFYYQFCLCEQSQKQTSEMYSFNMSMKKSMSCRGVTPKLLLNRS